MLQAREEERHEGGLCPQPLPRTKIATYPDGVPDNSDLRKLRVDKETWELYTQIVGERGRSADLKAYINWRIDNPTTPLPGRRRGPAKKTAPPKPDGSSEI
jgi:hypothetical protein